jgi:hypothetical protein
MLSRVQGGGGFPSTVLVLALGTWAFSGPSALAHDHYGDGAGKVGGPIAHGARISPPGHGPRGSGTLGYGPPGLHPGFQGFGLGYHPGYGYGGYGLGVGAFGGYPCYGGPGYPIRYGYPTFANPYYDYKDIGPLVYDPPVVITELIGAGDFGPFTGASAYAYTHPSFAAEAAATGSIIPGVSSAPDTSATTPVPEATYSGPSANVPPGPAGPTGLPLRQLYLGMDVEPVVDAGGRKGLKIVSVLRESTAEKAGLQAGDIIHSINGSPTEQRGQMAAIIAGTGPGNVLRMNVRKAGDGREQTVTIQNP